MKKYVIDLQIFSKKLCKLLIDKGMIYKKKNPIPDPIQLYNALNPNDKISRKDIEKFGRSNYSIKVRSQDDWIKGKHYPKNISDVLNLCNALECDLDYLFTEDMICHTHDEQFISDYTGLSKESIKLLHKLTTYDKGKPRLFILDYFIRNVKFSLYLTDKIKDYFDKRDRYKRWEKKFLQEEEEQRNLDIFELLEYPQTISRSKLKEYENVKDAAHFQVQKDFDDILEIFIKYLDKYNIQIPDTNQDME